MTTTNTPLILVDGSSYLFRAYHALPPLTNSKGQPTGAMYGVVNMIRKLMDQYHPEKIAVIFDSKEKTARHHFYEHYKANRPTMPEDLQSQIQPLHEIIRAMGLPLLIVPGVEADDLIGTLAKQAEAKKIPVLISTGDKDFAQLVNPHITLINTMTNKTLDREAVLEKFGVAPEQIIDYLTLMGDSIDNVPGVPNVGPKTAAKWLNEYHTLENLLKHADTIKGKVGENLRASKEQLKIAEKLVTIDINIPLPITLHDLTPQAPDEKKLHELFSTFEFKSWLQAVEKNDDSSLHRSTIPSQRQQTYPAITTEKEFYHWLEKLKKAHEFALDTETDNLDALCAQLVGISIAIAPSEAFYVPLKHRDLVEEKQLSTHWVFEQLKSILTDPKRVLIGQNIKFDYKVLANAGLILNTQFHDTMLMSYVLDTSDKEHNLDFLAKKHLDHEMISYESLTGKGKNQITFDHVPISDAANYSGEDADITLQLHAIFSKKMAEEHSAQKVLEKIEWPLILVLARMEMHGVLVDVHALKKQSQYLGKKIQELQEKIYAMAGRPFNVASPQQLGDIFYNHLKLPILKKTPKGQPSTAEEVLQELALQFPLPALILEYRSLSKLKSTYTDTLPLQMNARTGRIHTSYMQTGTSTGRLASKDPNLQNIPIKTEEGKRIREAFIAPPGYKILSADYSQVELRIMAHLSQDKNLISAFEKGLDIHQATAAEILNIPLDQVTSEQRRRAKAVNFGLIYGMSAFGLSQQLKIERNEAQHYIDTYFARYPGVKQYMEKTRELARKQGYVSTAFGRKLYLPDVQSSNVMQRKAAERAAINAPMQGTAAEMIKLAMIHIDHWIQSEKIDARMIMQVHDELVFEINEKEIDFCSQKIRDFMQNAFSLSVPVLVDVGVGDNWGEAH